MEKGIGKIMPIICDSPTPHFSSGCELLLHYDANNDGLINLNELNQSYTDYENGIITEEEFDLVSDAYINGGINVICPDCFLMCIQNFVVYDRIGNPVVGEWTVHVEISEEDTGVLIEEKECVVDSNGKCSIELLKKTAIKVHATKNTETSTSYGSPACFTDTIYLWQTLSCKEPTPNHASGRDMLLYWDKDNDGIISEGEAADATLEYLLGGAISINEMAFIIECYEGYGGVIDDFCSSTVGIMFSANVADATLYVDGEHKGVV